MGGREGEAGKAKSGLLVYVFVALGVVFLAGGAAALMLVKLVRQPSGSMLPTIKIGDRLVVSRLDRDGAYGEVILFRFPDNREQLFVKRVIARPGDTLEVIDGRPIVNGKLVPACEVGKIDSGDMHGYLVAERYGGHSYLVMYDDPPHHDACKKSSDCGGGRECRADICGFVQGPYTAKADELWVMGDNRNNSHDSRSWNGGMGAGVPFDDVIGGAFVDEPPKLPAGADALADKLARCLDELAHG